MLWLGPEFDEDIQADFETFFARSLKLTGSIYYQAESDEMNDMFSALAKTRKCYDLDSFPTPLDKMRGLLPPRKALILEAHCERQSLTADSWISDLDRWPESRGDTSNENFPSQLIHGTLYSWDHERPATCWEHMHAQGFHMYSAPAWSVSPVRRVLEERGANQSQVKFFSGNGMHLSTQASWCLYVWAHTRARPTDSFIRMPQEGVKR